MKYFFNLLIFIILLFSTGQIYSQQNPSYQLYVRNGGSVDFKIITVDQYENGNIVYDSWTTLQVNYSDTTSGQQKDAWKLGFKVDKANFDCSYSGSFSASNLSLQIVTNSYDSLDENSNNLDLSRVPLTDSWTTLADGVDEGYYEMDITYRLDSALISTPPGFYNNLIIFDIAEQSGSFD